MALGLKCVRRGQMVERDRTLRGLFLLVCGGRQRTRAYRRRIVPARGIGLGVFRGNAMVQPCDGAGRDGAAAARPTYYYY